MSLETHFTPFYLLANCRRVCSLHFQRQPDWVLAMELFAVGSTTAWRLCVEAEIDPEGTTVAKLKKELKREAAE